LTASHLPADRGQPTADPLAHGRFGDVLSLRDLLVTRFALYLMAHAFRRYAFLERSLGTLRHLIDLDLERP